MYTCLVYLWYTCLVYLFSILIYSTNMYVKSLFIITLNHCDLTHIVYTVYAITHTSTPLPSGWVCYAEKTHGSYILPHISTTKSAQQIMGSLVKYYLAEKVLGTTLVSCCVHLLFVNMVHVILSLHCVCTCKYCTCSQMILLMLMLG